MVALSALNRRIVSFAVFLLFLCGTGVFSVPTPAPVDSTSVTTSKPFGTCRKIYVRKEWRTLTLVERFQYLRAVNYILCKDGITPRSLAAGIRNRYDDLVYTHLKQTFDVHFVGPFLPFHRYLTWTFEKMLRDEGGYTGPMPYWNWHLDLGRGEQAFLKSPIFDPVLGHGGNGDYVEITPPSPFSVPGRTGGGCVPNGAFKYMTVNLGPAADTTGNPRCLTRDFSFYFTNRYLGKNQTKITLQAKDFYDFDKIVEGGPSFEASGVHGGGHYGIGGTLGTMGDLYISPNDPAFWLHHANLDRVWWSWQKLKFPERLTDFGGPSCIMDWYNASATPTQKCANATLAQPLNLGYADLVKQNVGVKVQDVMDIRNMCYDYDELYDPAKL